MTAALRVVGGKWRGLIWWRLSKGIERFGGLLRSVPQISRKVLIEELRHLEHHGVVERKAHGEVPPRVEYSLTDYGRTLAPVIECLCDWGAGHLSRKTVPDSGEGGTA